MERDEIRGKSNNGDVSNTTTHFSDSTRTTKSATNKDKFSQEEITAYYLCHLRDILNEKIHLCDEEAKAVYYEKRGHVDFDDFPDLKEDFNGYLFWHKSKLIKSALAAHKEMIKYLEKNYREEIQYSKEDKYILGESPRWMMEDEKILQNLERFPLTIPILNYLWNLNRFTRGDELVEMFSLTKEVTGGKKHITEKNKEYGYATFVTNSEFYNKMSKKIGCSINYIQKYLISFNKIWIIKKLGNVGRNGTLYADGYYVTYLDKYRKEVFLKNNRAFKTALRSFDPLASHSVQNMRLEKAAAFKDDTNRVTKDEIIIAAEMLNETGLAAFKLETSGIDLRKLRKMFLSACESIPETMEEGIPDSVADVYNKLVSNRD